MKLAVSNIAWPTTEDPAAWDMMRDLGISHLEMAPTRHWPDLARVSERDARAMAERLDEQGIAVCAFQAILFGQPQLQLFGDDHGHDCRVYLKAVCRLAGWMGARAIVFGSPKNRLRGDLSPVEAMTHAVDFFREIGEAAAAAKTILCLEANPAAYGGDFLLTVAETAELAHRVNSPGVAINFDMGEQAMHQAEAAANVVAHAGVIGHFHASEPMLEPFDATRRAHHEAADALRRIGYAGVVSLEMKAPPAGLSAVRSALQHLQSRYSG
jgi:D-psicose/D-tagatose/L-ribulose 3-epimerase